MKPLRPALALVLALTLALSSAPFVSGGSVHKGGNALPQRSPRLTGKPLPKGAVADDRLIVRLRGPKSAAKIAAVAKAAGTSTRGVGSIRGGFLTVRVPKGVSRSEFVARLKATGKVAYAEPNYLRQLAGYTPPSYVEPNDPAFTDTTIWGYPTVSDPDPNVPSDWFQLYPHGKSWWIRDIGAVPAWHIGYTGPSIAGNYPLRASGDTFKVAVLDTGFYANHPDVGVNIVAGSTDATPVDQSLAVTFPDTFDNRVAEVSHGTCVSGEIAATVANGVGTLGNANDTQVRVYKVYFGGEGIADDDLISAITQATDDGCKVINMSIAGGPFNSALQDAITYAWEHGVVVVAAAGNDFASTVAFPAAMQHVVAVGALAHSGDGVTRIHSDFSDTGSALDMSAPGEWVWGLAKPDYTDPDAGQLGYRWWDGTSMASPIVAGGIAWLWRAAPMLSNDEMVSLIQSTAHNLGAPGRDNTFGYGDFDMDAAYLKLKSDYHLLGAPDLNVDSQTSSRNVKISWPAKSGYHVTYSVAVDSTELTSGMTAANITLPYDTTVGPHTVSIVATSPRNWLDGSESATIGVNPPASLPEVQSLRYYRGNILWNTTEDGFAHTSLLSVDGGAPMTVSGNSTSTASLHLALGSHTASFSVEDSASVMSVPTSTAFTIRTSPTLKRISASDRYWMATSLSRTAFPSASTAVLVSDASWFDAMAAGPLARVVRGPVLVAKRTSLPTTTYNELKRLKVKKIIIVGNASAISSSLRDYLAKTKHFSVSRVSGKDRFETANAVARSIASRKGGSVADNRAVVVSDSRYTNAVAASTVAARKGWPLVFTKGKFIQSSTKSALAAIHVNKTLVVGDFSTVSNTGLVSPTRITSSSYAAIPTGLATWATTISPGFFSGERIFVAGNSAWSDGLALPAAAAVNGGLVLVTSPSLQPAVKNYFTANSEVAVKTQVVGSTTTIPNSIVTTLKGITGAP